MRKVRDRAVEVIDRPWVSKTPILRPSTAAYPAPLQCPITFVPAAPISVFEFGQTVTALCGVPVRITADAIAALSGGSRAGSRTPDMTPPSGASGPMPPGGVGALGAGGSASAPLSMSARDTTISGIRWDGKPLPGLLDATPRSSAYTRSSRKPICSRSSSPAPSSRHRALAAKARPAPLRPPGRAEARSQGARRRPLWSRLSRTWPKTSIA
ncbi:hypothetical protein G6F68_012078 [Rhizopus microsporus]|nr:hypothetical protein G6F68_012078 [Rhizopus microsporus]